MAHLVDDAAHGSEHRVNRAGGDPRGHKEPPTRAQGTANLTQRLGRRGGKDQPEDGDNEISGAALDGKVEEVTFAKVDLQSLGPRTFARQFKQPRGTVYPHHWRAARCGEQRSVSRSARQVDDVHIAGQRGPVHDLL